METTPRQAKQAQRRAKRSHGMGGLVDKGPGKPFLARWMVNGKVHTQTTHETDRRKALVALERITRPFREKSDLERLENLKLEIEKRLAIAQPQPQVPEKTPPSIDQMFDLWETTIRKKNTKEQSRHLYRQYFNALEEWAGKNSVENASQMGKVQVQAFIESLTDHVSGEGVNLRISFYRRVWKAIGEQLDGWEVNPSIWDVEKMKAKGTKRRSFTEEEIKKIWDATSGDMDRRVLVATGLYTGMRISDCGMLRWSDVDFGRKTVSVVTIKTGDYLEIPLHPTLEAMLQKQRKVSGDGIYVSAANSGVQAKGKLSEGFCGFLRGLGFTTHEDLGGGRRTLILGFHSFRRHFISWALNSGRMSTAMVQRIVGHAALATTMRYYDYDVEKMREALSAMPELGV